MRTLARIVTSALLVLLGVGTLGLMLAAWQAGETCRAMTGAWLSLVSLEAVRDPADLEVALAACYGGSVERAVREVDADTWFVVPTVVPILAAWRYFRSRRPRWAWRYGVGATLAAGVADVAENASLRELLGAPWLWVDPPALALASTLKWVLLVGASVTLRGAPGHRAASASMIAVLPGVALGPPGLSWLTLALGVGWTAFGVLDLIEIAYGPSQRSTL